MKSRKAVDRAATHGGYAGERDAVPKNSGQPVHHSGPGLNEPTLSPTFGQKPEARPPVQPKSGRGVEQSSTGREAACRTSLDSIEINRNTLGRGKHCGRFTVCGRDETTGAKVFYRVNCKCWGCKYCGPRKAKRYKRAIREMAERHNLCHFVTLTLDPSKISGDPVQFLNDAFAKLRTYFKRRFGRAPEYIRVLEFQKSGNPHFHLIIDRFVVVEWLKKAWRAVSGARVVDVRFIDIHRISRYLSKYLTKELLLSAPLRTRRVTTSRSIHLFEKSDKPKMQLMDIPIWLVFVWHKNRVLEIGLDEESVLKSFSIRENDHVANLGAT